MKTLITTVALGGCLLLHSAGFVFAANPHNAGSNGPPSKECLEEDATIEPGHAASSPGSTFNELDPGTGNAAYNAVGAPSQYDVACFQQTQRPRQVP